MRTRRRLLLSSSLVLIGGGVALAACVGDDPTTGGDQNDASTSSDGSNAADSDAAINDTGSSTTDASDAAVETFDGANPTCNALFPQDAPAAVTIECDAGTITPGGTIQIGRYYLVDEKYALALCPASPTSYDDVIDITSTGDGGFTVNAALNNPSINARFTYVWAVTGNAFSQYTACPNNGNSANDRPFSANGDTLVYNFPPFGNLTFKQF